MARARNIKPALFKNEVLGVADPLYTLAFEGLWLLADREGRLEDRPMRIKAEIFPYRDGLNIENILDWLASSGFIARYRYGENRYIQVINFGKHQNPHKNEAQSEIPEISDGCTTSDFIGTDSDSIGSAPADSLSLDSLSLDSLSLDSLNTEIPPAPSAPASKVKPDPLQGFAEFWIKYPRKTAKQDAEKAWARLKPSVELQSTLITAVDHQAKSLDWTKDGGKFIPHPATWLNGKRWEDQLTDAPLSKHGDFDKRDYYAGLTQREDGTYAF